MEPIKRQRKESDSVYTIMLMPHKGHEPRSIHFRLSLLKKVGIVCGLLCLLGAGVLFQSSHILYKAHHDPFGNRSYDWHPGVDIANDYGAPVYASASGTIEEAGWVSGYGRYVRIQHGYGYETAYGHMSKLAVQAGQSVSKGDVIGYVGSSGYSTGPHVHFEVLVNGQTTDPLELVR